jgi:hypothetical protein
MNTLAHLSPPAVLALVAVAYVVVGIPACMLVGRILRAGSEHLDRTPTESRACVVTAKPSGGPPSLPPPPPVR